MGGEGVEVSGLQGGGWEVRGLQGARSGRSSCKDKVRVNNLGNLMSSG